MSFAPVLDAPSAVGDEGRPRATSLAVVSLVVVGLVTAVGYRIGQWDLALSLTTFTGLSAAGLALLDRERFVHGFFGHALLTWFGMPVAGLVFLSPAIGLAGVAVAGFAVALFGLTATWSDTGDRRSLRRGLYAVGRTTVATWLWLTVGLLVVGVAVLLVDVPAAGASTPTAALLGFAAVVVVASIGVLVGLRWLPLRELAPRPERDRVATTVRRLQVASGVATATAVVLAAAAILAPAGDGAVGGLRALAAVAAPVLGSRLALGAVVVTAGTVFLAGLLARSARAIARRGAPSARDRLAAALAALPLAVLVLLVISVAPLAGLAVAVAIFALQFLLLLALAVTYAAAALAVIPDRAGAPAMTAAGLVLAAIPAASVSPALAVACVAVACLSWDLSTFGLGVTAELGHRPRVRRLELVHGLVAVAVGALAVGAVLALASLRPVVAGGTVPAVLVAAGALLVAGTIRG
jgi:hypothetical protein